jgi:hypothetical protein
MFDRQSAIGNGSPMGNWPLSIHCELENWKYRIARLPDCQTADKPAGAYS